MKKIALFTLLLICSTITFSAENITGLWKSISDETNLVQSITLVYEYEGKVYGRLLVVYDHYGKLVDTIANPVEKAYKIVGDPYYSGLDFIWGMEDKGKKWSKRKIIDPEPAKI